MHGLVRASIAPILILAGIGCGCVRTPEPVIATLFGRFDLKPDSAPPKNAVLILAGTEIPISIRRDKDGSIVRLTLLSNDEVIEEEVYTDTNDSFSFVEGGGETYSPAIPLISYPGHVGEIIKWQGDVDGTKAVAEVTGKRVPSYFNGSQSEVLEVRVNLTIQSEVTNGPMRQLVFVIAPDRGVVRREFGPASVRRVAGESP